jgi:hypothetical protein
MINYNTLVLSGGGIKGIAHLGCIFYLQDSQNFNINNINIFSGTSIGSVISLLFVCGYTPAKLMEELKGINSFLNINNMSLMSLLSKFGLFKIEELSQIVTEKVIRKFGYIPTLQKLFELTNKDLWICSVNSYNSEVVYFNYRTHPDKSCIEAVEDSCRIPLIFEKNKYLDGGLADNFPLLALTKNYNLQDLNILGILLTGKELMNSEGGDNITSSGTGILNYIYNLLNISINSNIKFRLEHIYEKLYGNISKKIDIITVQFERRTLIPLYISEEEKLKIFELGYKTMKEYYESSVMRESNEMIYSNEMRENLKVEDVNMNEEKNIENTKMKIDCEGDWNDF